MLVLLDRDGVINKDVPQSVTSPESFELLPYVGEALARLNHAGHKVALVTNQACVGRGDLSLAGLEAIHAKMHRDLAQAHAHIDQVYVCTDTKEAPHNRRKPAPGMILEALTDFRASPQETVVVGDDTRDLAAAHGAGCAKILLLTGKGRTTCASFDLALLPFVVLKDLKATADFLLSSPSSLPFP